MAAKRKLSDWVDGKVLSNNTMAVPAEPGWYETTLSISESAKSGFICSEGYCYWTGEKWFRPMGWPSAGNFYAFEFDDKTGKLIIPRHVDGEPIAPASRGAFREVSPDQWRGFVEDAESVRPKSAAGAAPVQPGSAAPAAEVEHRSGGDGLDIEVRRAPRESSTDQVDAAEQHLDDEREAEPESPFEQERGSAEQ